jgi:hypothetical protein
MLEPPAPPEAIVPPPVSLLMVPPAGPPLTASASPALPFRPELLQANPTKPDTRRAAALGLFMKLSMRCRTSCSFMTQQFSQGMLISMAVLDQG